MNVLVYLIPAVFSAVMLINGAIRYWGHFDRASMEVMFDRYFETKREVRNWKQSQKIYGKNLLIAGLLNVLTEVALIPVMNRLLERADAMSVGMLLLTFLPSMVYMFGAWGVMQLKLKRIEDKDVEKKTDDRC